MNLTDKKRYFKPKLIVIPIDQEITLVMESPGEPPIIFGAPSKGVSSSEQSSEIFGKSETNVGESTINWGKK